MDGGKLVNKMNSSGRIKKRLTKILKGNYADRVVAKSMTGIGVLNVTGGHTATRAVFLCPKHGKSFMGGPWEELKNSPVPVPGTPTRTVPLTLIGVRGVDQKSTVLGLLP